MGDLTPTSFGFVNPTDAEIEIVIKTIIEDQFDGQRVTLERTAKGNVGHYLSLMHPKVIIPGPLRFAKVLKDVVKSNWAVFIKSNFETELYAPDIERLPSQAN